MSTSFVTLRSILAVALLTIVSAHQTPSQASSNRLANTKWDVRAYSVNGVPTELPPHWMLDGSSGRELAFTTRTYESRLDCVGDGGRYVAGNGTITVRTTYRIKPAIRCPDGFLSKFLLSKPRYRFSVDKRTLELRIDETGQRLLLDRI